MKIFTVILVMAALAALSVSAQSYSINWYKVAGGGGTSTSTGGTYSISGTIGQPDASSAMTGGNYSLTGGFWALISVVQIPGAPTLFISHSGNAVTVYWQNVSGWTLQQNNNLTTPLGWAGNSSWTTSGGTNYLNLTSPTGNLYFRLANP
jgi:opacity protein-like surface antigen